MMCLGVSIERPSIAPCLSVCPAISCFLSVQTSRWTSGDQNDHCQRLCRRCY